MKKLLNKTVTVFTIYSFFVLIASIPLYHYIVDGIWLKELDEHNEIIADRAQNRLNTIDLNENQLAEAIELWNKVQPGTNLIPAVSKSVQGDSVYVRMKPNPYKNNELDRFRGLRRLISINGKPYLIEVETNVEESEETVMAIALMAFCFFVVLVIGFILLTRKLSQQVWLPFRDTLNQLQKFNLNHHLPFDPKTTDIIEFDELNKVLQKLIAENIAVYKSQKEFTENASHELQTPLAIIKNKLDLLLQEDLSNREYGIIEDINNTVNRITKINKNLLLLAKLENRQFTKDDDIQLDVVLSQTLDNIRHLSEGKDIRITDHLKPTVIKGNKVLVEILAANLLSNAVRHVNNGGQIKVKLFQEELLVQNDGDAKLEDSLLFKRFAKADGHGKGNGLGLSVIKQICDQQSWTISYTFDDGLHGFLIKF